MVAGKADNVEGRAQAIARYNAKDPAGRDIDLEKGEVSNTFLCCTIQLVDHVISATIRLHLGT